MSTNARHRVTDHARKLVTAERLRLTLAVVIAVLALTVLGVSVTAIVASVTESNTVPVDVTQIQLPTL